MANGTQGTFSAAVVANKKRYRFQRHFQSFLSHNKSINSFTASNMRSESKVFCWSPVKSSAAADLAPALFAAELPVSAFGAGKATYDLAVIVSGSLVDEAMRNFNKWRSGKGRECAAPRPSSAPGSMAYRG